MRRVTVMFRNSFFGGNGWTYYPVQIEIGDRCPECGGPRGEPAKHTFRDCGEWFTVDTWQNPCGHLDTYKSCLLEAWRITKQGGMRR